MLTPTFDISQDEDFVHLEIRCPYIKTSMVEFFIEGRDFHFWGKPYLLKLELPGNVVEDGRESAKYDVIKGILEVRIPKEVSGQHFPDLEFLSKMVITDKTVLGEKKPSLSVLIEDLNDEATVGQEIDEVEISETKPKLSLDVSPDVSYGFNDQYSGFFQGFNEQMMEIIELNGNPDLMTDSERRASRMSREDEKFDEDAYIADLCDEDEIIQSMMLYTPWFHENDSDSADLLSKLSLSDESVLTESEKSLLARLPKKIISMDSIKSPITLIYGVLDILLAYCYELRFCHDDFNVESTWTICKLSSTLSCFEKFDNVRQVFYAFSRRILCYPLIRSYRLMPIFLDDLIVLLKGGKGRILSIFLKLYGMFERDDLRYLVNRLYLDDYLRWIQNYENFETDLAIVMQEIVSDVNLDELKIELNSAWKLDSFEKLVQEDEESITGSISDHLKEDESDESDDDGSLFEEDSDFDSERHSPISSDCNSVL